MGWMEEFTLAGTKKRKGVDTLLCIYSRKISGVSQLEAG